MTGWLRIYNNILTESESSKKTLMNIKNLNLCKQSSVVYVHNRHNQLPGTQWQERRAHPLMSLHDTCVPVNTPTCLFGLMNSQIFTKCLCILFQLWASKSFFYGQQTWLTPLVVDVFTNTNNNKTQAFQKDGERRARRSYVPLHFVCDEHGYGDDNSNILLRLSGDDPGKKSRACAERLIRSTAVYIWIELSRGLNPIRSGFFVRLRCLHELSNSVLL